MSNQTGLNRDTIDKFYTKKNIASLCIDYVNKYLNISDNSIIIEPSAGNGSFSNILNKIYKNVISYDIDPGINGDGYNNIIKQDYLEIDLSIINNDINKKIRGTPVQAPGTASRESSIKKDNNIIYKDTDIHIIGNPPFGRQSSLAKKFIKKSSSFCSSISFILPKSFKKSTMKKSFPMNFHLLFEIDLPDYSFEINYKNEEKNNLESSYSKKEYNVPCIFQIWIKKNIDRLDENIIDSKYFKFVKKYEKPDFSLRRVGINAGKIDFDIDKNEQSHYFIRLNECIDKNNFINKYKLIQKNIITNNTVGPKSINKQEFIKYTNEIVI
jgi:hypothetical protein